MKGEINMDLTLLFPGFVIFIIVIAMIAVALNSMKNANPSTFKRKYAVKGYSSVRRKYVPGQFSEQMEIDMRLPFRRFKQLYPENVWTYEEYKKMQMRTAFRRSHSSQDNKRMVR
jgi:hypothetical protein